MNITTTKGAGAGALNFLVYGESGAGKTYLAGTTGDDANTLIISAEGGLLTLADRDIPVFDITAQSASPMDALTAAFQMLRSGTTPFKWVIIDSLSEVAEVCLAGELAGTSKEGNQKHGMQAYGAMQDRMTRLIRSFRDLPLNVVMLAKQGRVQDDTGRTFFGPDMPGKKLSQGVAYHFDEVFWLTTTEDEDGQPVRAMLTIKTDQHVCKDRSNRLDTWEPPNLARVAAKITAAPAAPKED